MENQLINLPFVFVLLLALSGSVMISGRVGAESVTVQDCKISCEKGSPKLLSGKWTCVDEVGRKYTIVSTPTMVSTANKVSSSGGGCDRVMMCQGISCGDVNDCGDCCGIGMAPFCLYHQCGCI